MDISSSMRLFRYQIRIFDFLQSMNRDFIEEQKKPTDPIIWEMERRRMFKFAKR